MTHPQVFGQKFTPIRRFLAWKTHPFWPHIPNMTQYGVPPPRTSVTSLSKRFTVKVRSSVKQAEGDPICCHSEMKNNRETQIRFDVYLFS